jgi:hypothetical protein
MSNKPPPPDSENSIELDEDHRATIEKVHDKWRKDAETSFLRVDRQSEQSRKEGTMILNRALSGNFARSVLEQKLTRALMGLWFICFVSVVWLALDHALNHLTLGFQILGLQLRPFACFLIFTALLTTLTYRLRLKSLFREIHYALQLAKPDLALSNRTELKVKQIHILNQLNAVTLCVLASLFAFSITGWEAGLSSIKGAHVAIPLIVGFGVVIWLVSRSLFELEDE